MSTYKNGIQTKKQLIEHTYNALLSNRVSELKVRDLAKKSGCAPSSVYQHFSSLNNLVTVASIKFLDEYTLAYSKMLNESTDIIESYLNGWELFCKFAFKKPDVFYHLFWGLDALDLEEAIMQYYSVFPLNPPKIYSIQYYLTFLTGDVVERDFMLMRTMASQGLVTVEDARYVSIVVTSIARNFLAGCRNTSETEREKARAQCMELVRYTLNMALNSCRYQNKAQQKKASPENNLGET
ncbi:MAG: TetR/AcrR family transcriptional regulator [Ruminococcus sp.]|jgi:AcrR family transcriptional regulator